MNTIVLFSVLSYFAFVLFISVFLKRRYRVGYDRKTLVSGLLFMIVSMVIWRLGEITSWQAETMTYRNKIHWFIIIVLGSNSLVQFILWLIYTFIRKHDLAKMPRFIFNIFSFLIFTGVLLYSLKTLFNVDLSGLLITSTVLSAIIGLSLQDTLTNLFAGVSLQMESPFNLDDWVNVGGFEGRVVSQNWRTLTLVTRQNHWVSLPNKAVAEEKIVNYSKPLPRQIHNYFFELDYSHPPNEVKEILCDLLNEIKEVSIDEAATPYVVSYEASGVRYCLKYWIEDYTQVIAIQDIVLTRLWYRLKRHNIKIPYTIQEIHLQYEPPDSHVAKDIDRKIYIKERLSEQKWLSQLEEGQIKILSESAILEKYAQNDDLVSQGDDGDSMFIITKGSAKVILKGLNDSEVMVANKLNGDFFGEMSLLTGDPRTATVRAATDLEVIVLNKKAFTEILLKDDKILDLLISALDSNQSNLTKIIEDERKNSNIPMKSAREIITNKIRKYLDL